jgi:protein involved in polysaccharide export with SLBB domain
MYLNGRWVQVTQATPEGASGAGADEPRLVTQRIIEVPTGPLLKGAAQYNIVIRPGDVISVPGPDLGLVYIGGPGIARPGVYQMPQVGRLTLKQAIISAGGLSAVGIPERVDLTRRIGDDREATIRLNMRAIFESTQPDLFLKPDDQVNVGTHFWAQPAAIIRNGFRMTYGFGFLLDRNFGNDVFGAPPVNRLGQ